MPRSKDSNADRVAMIAEIKEQEAKGEVEANLGRIEQNEEDHARAQAEDKFQSLTERRRLRDIHLDFDRFCEVVLNQPLSEMCNFGLLPRIGQLKQFAFYLALTRKSTRNSRIKLVSLLSSIQRETRVLNALTGQSYPKDVMAQLSNYLTGFVKTSLQLPTVAEEKVSAILSDYIAVLGQAISTDSLLAFPNMRDALNVLLFINIYIDTAARGSDLLTDEGPSVIRWKNIKFQLLQPLKGSTKVRLGAEVSYAITKRTIKRAQEKVVLLQEQIGQPMIYDTVFLLFVAASVDRVLPEGWTWERLHDSLGLARSRNSPF